MIVAERNAGLFADKPDATPPKRAANGSERSCVHSPAPFWIGVALFG